MALVDVLNRGLQAIGVPKVASTSETTTVAGNLIKDNYVSWLKEVFVARDWRCLERYKQLAASLGTLTLSAKTVGTGKTFTSSANIFDALLDVGALIYEGGDDGTGVAEVTGWTSQLVVTCEITTAFTHGLAGDAIPAGDWRIAPLADYGYQFPRPTNCLKVLALDDATDAWAEQAQRILTDLSGPVCRFTLYSEDESWWDVGLTEAVVWKVAMEAAYPCQKGNLWKEMAARYAQALAQGSGLIHQGRNRRGLSQTRLLDVR